MNSVITYPPGCKDIQVELANDELIRRLKKIQQQFQLMDQSADNKYKELAIFLGSEFFLEHYNEDVQLLVACCLGDVFRVYAPDYPFQDSFNLKNIFMFLANQLKGLKDNSNAAFKRYFYLLENLECVRTFLICQELDDSQEVIVNLFENVFKIVNDKTIQRVRQLFFDLLHPLLNDADQISTKVLDLLFARIIEPAKSNNREAYTLAVNLLKKGNQHFEYLVQNHLNSTVLTGRSSTSHNLTISNFNESNLSSVNIDDTNDSDQILNSSLNNIAGQSSEAAKAAGVHGAGSSNQFITDKMCLIIYEINQIRPALLELVMPQLEYKLKSSDQKERREYTRLLSKMFSEKDSKLAQQVPQLWEAYLDRFADMNDDIRKICIQHISDFLIQQSEAISQAAASNTSVNHHQTILSSNTSQISEQIIEQVKSRSLDPDEALRFEVVQEILKSIKMDTHLVTSDLLNILKERTLDIKIKIRKSALQGLAQLYKKAHSKNNSRHLVQLHNWIPSTILKIYFQDSIEDKLMVERLLNSCIVPYTFGAKEKMAQLYYAFTTFDDYSMLSLIEIMKNRVLLYQLMKSIIELNDLKSPENAAKLDSEIMLVSTHLLDTTKGNEFIKLLLGLFKKNLNLKNYFKNFVNLCCSASKSMQLIQLIFTNLNTLNNTQMSMARRLIERMSSLIIDKECLESLIELVEYKIKQKLTPEQRRMLKKKSVHLQKSKQKISRSKQKVKSFRENDEDSTDEENVQLSSDEESLDELRNDENDGECADDDETTTLTTETSNREDTEDLRNLLKHIDDDGEKGLKLINIILMIHQNYGFANPTTYEKMFVLVNSRKDHIVSSNLKFLSHHFTKVIRSNYSAEEIISFESTNKAYLEKLKYLVRNGKPKQVKYAIYVIYNNFDKDQYETILYDLYNDLYKEAISKNVTRFIPSIIGLGHITTLIPSLVAKDMKDFVVQIIAKDLLLNSPSTPFNISLNESATTTQKRKNNLKLAGKWCDNEDELPFYTRARIEGVKLMTRWCLGLKSECTNITTALRLFTKIIKENSSDHLDESHEDKQTIIVTEAERSRIRSVCGNQIIKLAQENSFKPLINAEYFHIVARLIIDPVTNVRDILIKKIQKGLQSYKLPIYYMSIFALSGLDTNRERKTRIKKIYSTLIAKIRLNDIKNQKKQLESKVQRTRILPEMCLPYAVSLLAHNTNIDSLKEDSKVKQVKECMAVILDPLIEKIDSYQVAYIKKILNKIKISDDGIASVAMANASQTPNQSVTVNKATIYNLYTLNKKLCLICEIFLFHMYSKSTTYLTAKEYEFDVKLPVGFYAARDNSSESSIKIDRFNSEENMKKLQDKEIENEKNEPENSEETEVDKENLIVSSKSKGSRIEIISRKRPSTDSPERLTKSNSKISENLKDVNESNDSLNKSPPRPKRNKPNKTSPAKETSNMNESSESLDKSPPPQKRNKPNKTSPVRKSTRGAKKVDDTVDEIEPTEINDNDDEKQVEDVSMSSKRSTRRTATPSTPIANSVKTSAVTKSSKKKSHVEVKEAEKATERPVRSLRTTRASANK